MQLLNDLHRKSMKTQQATLSPILQFTAARVHRKMRIAAPIIPRHPLSIVPRATLAKVRAAELVSWEESGGDYLRAARIR